MMQAFNLRRFAAAAALLVMTGLSGCGVITVVGAVAGAAISVTGAVVSTGVKVTGKVIEKTIDVITPSSDKPTKPEP
jgi:ABC-type taurine transport system ATPase subunit